MLQKILDFIGKPAQAERLPNQSRPEIRQATARPANRQNDATRPSYRIGKHKSSDIHKAIDLSG
ncbi:MAG: hypothetical protein D6768_05225 [Chloroflexi bacterium]|nr:MAG: hypothetical protein D6768_05225 [Chloroflexota bacterium]